MDVQTVGEGLLQLADIGDMGDDAKLDLAVIGRDQLGAGPGDEGGADAPSLLGADRDVLQVGLGRGQAAGGGGGERIGGVDAAGLGMDEARQQVGIGRLQLGELAPVEDAGGERVAACRELVEDIGAGRPGAGLGLLAAGQAELAEEDIAQLLGRADVEVFAGEFVDLALQGRRASGRTRRRAATGSGDRR